MQGAAFAPEVSMETTYNDYEEQGYEMKPSPLYANGEVLRETPFNSNFPPMYTNSPLHPNSLPSELSEEVESVSPYDAMMPAIEEEPAPEPISALIRVRSERAPVGEYDVVLAVIDKV
jgi:hypothetical protein